MITEGVFQHGWRHLIIKGQLTEISEKTNAITIVDDAHGDFVI